MRGSDKAKRWLHGMAAEGVDQPCLQAYLESLVEIEDETHLAFELGELARFGQQVQQLMLTNRPPDGGRKAQAPLN